MMRPIALALLLVCAALAAPAQETRIAAVVNDDIVTAGDVASRLQLVMRSSNIPDTPENRQRLTNQVLKQLIDEKLELQEAKRLSITVPKDEVDKALEGIEQRNNMPKGGLDQYLKQAGVPRITLVDQITANLAFTKILRNRVSQDVSVSDEEVNEAMTDLKADIGKPQSRVAEIFLSVDNPSQADEVKRLADRLIEQIRGGANFSAVAQQFSQSPSAAVGGDLGWVTPSGLSPLLGEAILKMKPGEMSYPIRTPAGYYIIYLADRRTLGDTSPDQITLSLVEVVFPLAANATPEEHQRVEAQAQAVTNAAKSCGEMTKIGQEQAPQLSRQVPQVRASELPPELRDKILALKVAQPSQPLDVANGVGVVMVCDRQEPAGMPTREQVQSNIERERLDTLARRYLRDLRRDSYVDIRG